MDQAPQDQELRNIIDKVCFKLDLQTLLSNGGVGVWEIMEILKVNTGVLTEIVFAKVGD